jgi:hypothetical protein
MLYSPERTASSASAQITSTAGAMPDGPFSTGKVMSIVIEAK